MQTKAGKRVGRRRKITSLKASAQAKKRGGYLPAELSGMYRPIKKPVTLRLDADVIAWFQRQGHGYQTRINQALRKLMLEERKKE